MMTEGQVIAKPVMPLSGRRRNENQNRYTKNQEQRRQLDRLLAASSDADSHHNPVLLRREPTEMDQIQFLQALKDNNIAAFGLIKLSGIDVNRLFVVDSGNSRSLLHHAVMMNRDKIAIALLRAGASIDGFHRHHAVSYPLPYIAWLLRYELTRSTNDSICAHCGKTGVSCVHFAICEHLVCSHCFWGGIDKLDGLHWNHETSEVWRDMLDAVICCPMCGQGVNTDPQHTIRNLSLLMLPPCACKTSSYLKWKALPEVIPAHHKHTPATTRDKSHGGAMHLSEMAVVALGNTQSQRLDELRKGIARNDVRRVAAVIEAGVHLDSVDEYGMTALMLAVWLKHINVVKILLAAGADRAVCDALGNSAWTISLHAGCTEMTRLLLSVFATTATEPLGSSRIIHHMLSSTDDTSAVTTLIPRFDSQTESSVAFWQTGCSSGVKGAEPGAFHIDSCFSQSFLRSLLETHSRLTVAPSEKTHCASRSYFCDVSGHIVNHLEHVLQSLGMEALGMHHLLPDSLTVRVFPQMRFMHYTQDGSALAPHVDLSHKDVRDPMIKSTHTLILYLTDCQSGGGETVLLRSLHRKESGSSDIMSDSNVVASVSPQLGRLLIFPHFCPHEGRPIRGNEPKLLLRGEVYISIKM